MHAYKHAYSLHIYRNILQFVSITQWILFDILINVVPRMTVLLLNAITFVRLFIWISLLIWYVSQSWLSDLLVFQKIINITFYFFIWLFHYCSWEQVSSQIWFKLLDHIPKLTHKLCYKYLTNAHIPLPHKSQMYIWFLSINPS